MMSWCKMLNYSIKEGKGGGNKGRRQEGVSDNVITKDARDKKKEIHFKSTVFEADGITLTDGRENVELLFRSHSPVVLSIKEFLKTENKKKKNKTIK